MSELPDDIRADQALREGLRQLPVPETSADFDTRIQAAIHGKPPWWQMIWWNLKPVMSAAACSLAIMLALLRWSTQAPIPPEAPHAVSNTRAVAVEKVLENGDLTHASLNFLYVSHRLSSRLMTIPFH